MNNTPITDEIVMVQVSFGMTVDQYKCIMKNDNADINDTLLDRLEKLDEQFHDQTIAKIEHDAHFGAQVVVDIYLNPESSYNQISPSRSIIDQIKKVIMEYVRLER